MLRSFKKFGSQKCFGTRKYLGQHKTEKMRFPIKKFGGIDWHTYTEIGERVHNFGAGLKALGMESLPENTDAKAFEESTSASTMLIYEETCAPWMTSMIGAHSQSMVVATSYSTLGISAVMEAVQECGVAVILCNLKNVEKVKAAARDAPTLKAIVYTTNYVTDAETPAPVAPEDVLSQLAGPVSTGGEEEEEAPTMAKGPVVLSFEDVIALGKHKPSLPVAPSPDMPAVVMYTSGSTGKPKGVMIKHSSVVASVSGITNYLLEKGDLEGKQTYLAYLPAAHILELCAEFTHLCFGSEIGFADPKSISSAGAIRQKPDGSLCDDPMDPDYAPGGIGAFKPTMFAAVPKIWDIMKKGVEAKIGGMSPVIKWIMQVIFSARVAALASGRDTPLLKLLLKKKFHKMIGGRMNLAVTGGGPCSAEVQTFIRTMFCMPLVQGYALTETTCAGCIQLASDPRNGVVGHPLSSIEMKVVSCEGVTDRQGCEYKATDTKHFGAACLGRGEILIKGGSVSSGYYKLPDKTAEEFDDEGWFHTGDVGVWRTDGTLMIVDRIKNLIKLLGGEYIAVEAMEAAFASSVYVNGQNGGVLVYGDGQMDRAVALVQVDKPRLKNWAESEGIDATDFDLLCANPAAAKKVMDDMNACGTKANLGLNEKLGAVHLISGMGDPEERAMNSPWTPENNFLTASNKLNRKFIAKEMEVVLTPVRAQAIR